MGLILIVTIALGIRWIGGGLRPEHPTVRVVYCPCSGGALPFVTAATRGMFSGHGLDVQRARAPTVTNNANACDWANLLEQLARGEIQIAAGCPSRVVTEVIAEEPEQWAWLGAGLETTAGEPLCAVYARRSAGITELAALEGILESGHAQLAVPDEYWARESRQIWRFLSATGTAVLEPFTADEFAHHHTVAVLGGGTVLAALERDPRFVRLAVNLRAARLGDPYWAYAHLFRRDFADSHPATVGAVASALDAAREAMAGLPGQELDSLRRTMGILVSEGKKAGIPVYLPMGTRIDGIAGPWVSGRIDAMEVVRNAQFTFNPSAGRLPRGDSVEAEVQMERPGRAEELPPFSDPKPKDVYLNLNSDP